MQFQELQDKLDSIRQRHILAYWNHLTPLQKEILAKQIDGLDLALFTKQQQTLHSLKNPCGLSLEPFSDYGLAGEKEDCLLGGRLVEEGKTGCILVAGGQGTRLQFDGPKGFYPISQVKKKSLFQLFAEKTAAASAQAGRMLPLAIMTSPLNHLATAAYFQKNNYFGLQPRQVSFFSQSMLPFLSQEGNLLLETEGTLALGPDGNGSCLKHFHGSGIWEAWHSIGIEYVSFNLIDNPLGDPFDKNLFGFHAAKALDITVKSILRENDAENLGTIAVKDGRPQVIEYTEIPANERSAREKDGFLKHKTANISLFCFSMDFIRKAAEKYNEMPIHAAFKNAKILGEGCSSKAWKFERFIFDVMLFTNRIKGLVCKREDCFAPLKNYKGQDSPETVQAALYASDKKTLQRITQTTSPDQIFEIAQSFYYPTRQLKEKWRDKKIPDLSYIEP